MDDQWENDRGYDLLRGSCAVPGYGYLESELSNGRDGKVYDQGYVKLTAWFHPLLLSDFRWLEPYTTVHNILVAGFPLFAYTLI